MTPVDLAWFVGLFEGEGCISIEAKKARITLTIGMTDKDVVDRVKVLFPNHQNRAPVQPKPVRDSYSTPQVRHEWRVSDPQEVERIIRLMMPILGERRKAKALEALERFANRQPAGWYNRNKTHCAMGHEYSPENTTYGRGGNTLHRRCKTCLRLWSANYRAKRRNQGQVISA